MIDQVLYNTWRDSYAYAFQLRGWACREVLQEEISTERKGRVNFVVTESLVLLLEQRPTVCWGERQ